MQVCVFDGLVNLFKTVKFNKSFEDLVLFVGYVKAVSHHEIEHKFCIHGINIRVWYNIHDIYFNISWKIITI